MSSKFLFKYLFLLLIIINFTSCSKEEYLIDDDGQIIIPTRLTPNGDGIEDYWEVKDPKNLINNSYYSAKIFNSEQMIVFSSDNKTNQWIGNNPNGTPSNAGYYSYLVRYKTWNGTDKIRTGRIVLER